MTKPVPGIKFPFFLADQYPVVEGFRCVEILIPDTVENMALLAGLLKLPGRSFNWTGADQQKRYDLAESWRNAYDATDWEGCMDCEQLTACLQPLFDALQAQIEALQTQTTELQETVEEVQETQENNGASEQSLAQSTIEDELCGGATGLVAAMHQTNVNTYNETEAGAVDNFFELLTNFIRAVPGLGQLPYDEMFEIVNWYFENQFADYVNDFETIKAQLACDLKCFVQANDNTFDWDVWTSWLEYIGAQYPDNKAAQMFARYSPLRQNFLNQIAALINKDASLQSYFDTLSIAWDTGLLQPVECTGCECPTEWCHIIDLTQPLPAILTVPIGNATGFGIESIDDVVPTNIHIQRAAINIDFGTEINITKVSGIYDLTKGSFVPADPLVLNAVQLFDASIANVGQASVESQADSDGTDKELLFEDDVDAQLVVFIVQASQVTGSSGGGSCTLKAIEICGFGDEPDWSPAP